MAKSVGKQASAASWMGRIRGAARPASVVQSIREEHPVVGFGQVTRWLTANTYYYRKVFATPFPTSFGALRWRWRATPLDIEREVAWCAALVLSHADRVKTFVEGSAEYRKSLWVSAPEEALERLKQLEVKIGVSSWLLQAKLATLQRARGLEAQKAFVTSIRGEDGVMTLTAYLAYMVSYRNEPSVSMSGFEAAVEDSLTDVDDDPFRAYLLAHLLPQRRFSAETAAQLIAHSVGGAVVDAYEMLVRVLTNLPTSYLSPALREVAARLCALTSDARLEVLGPPTSDPMRKSPAMHRHVHDLELLLKGATSEALTRAAANLCDCPVDLNAFAVRLLAKSHDRLETEVRGEGRPSVLRDTLEDHLLSILRHGPSRTEDVQAVHKLMQNHFGDPFVSMAYSFVAAALPGRYGSVGNTATLGLPFSPLRVSTASGLSQLAGLVETAVAEQAIEVERIACGVRDGVWASAANDGELTQCIAMEAFVAEGKFAAAQQIAIALATSSAQWTQFVALRCRLRCLIAEEHAVEAVRLVVSFLTSHPDLVMDLELSELLRLSDSFTGSLSGEPTLSVFFDLCQRYAQADVSHKRAYACEDFLTLVGAQRPSELADMLVRWDHHTVVHFLRNVCVEAVLDTFTVFKSSKVLAEERIQVCKLLADFEPSLRVECHEEIRATTQRIHIQERLRALEESKIYVNMDGVRRAFQHRAREAFSRYTAFLRAGIPVADAPAVDAAIRAAENGEFAALAKLALPSNEVVDLFRSMVLDFRDEYVSSTEHGLDGYLSVRVRHGTLSGQLRKPLEDGRLVTRQLRDSGEYRDSHAWDTELGAWPEHRQWVARRLAQFSAEFDALVSEIAGQWLQVKKNPGDVGDLDFLLHEPRLAVLAASVTSSTTFEEFFMMLSQHFGVLLDYSLNGLRVRIDKDARARILTLLGGLERDVDGRDSGEALQGLGDAVREARTNMQVVISRITHWFQRREPTDSAPLPLEEVVRIAEASVRNFNASFRASISIEAPAEPVVGELTTPLVDALFIVFENIVRHSDIGDAPVADVRITEDGGHLIVKVWNRVAPSVDTPDARKRLLALRSSLERDGGKVLVSREGGTGFHKLQKILTHDLRQQPTLRFGFEAQDQFLVEFRLRTVVGA